MMTKTDLFGEHEEYVRDAPSPATEEVPDYISGRHVAHLMGFKVSVPSMRGETQAEREYAHHLISSLEDLFRHELDLYNLRKRWRRGERTPEVAEAGQVARAHIIDLRQRLGIRRDLDD